MNKLFNAVSLLALTPTAWAVYAGLTMTSTWPMPYWIAIPGAASLLIVSTVTAGYISGVSEFNKSLRTRDTSVRPVSIWQGWVLLGMTTTAEITLALLVSVIPGLRVYSVITFPMLGLAGVFVFTLRGALQDAIDERDKGRMERKQSVHPAEKVARQGSPEMQKRAACKNLQTLYSCVYPGCNWKPLVETLVQSGNPERSAKNARTAHNMHRHPSAIRVDAKAMEAKL